MASLLCLENPLLDIVAFGDQNLLAKYGLKPNDAILSDESRHHLFDDLIQNHSAQMFAGGGGQNTARGAQYLLPLSSVLYIGCVGQDSYADALLTSCQRAEVQAEYLIDESFPTGRCGVIITDKHRSLCTDLGAAKHYKLDHLKQPHIWDMVKKAKVYFVGGYHLTVCAEAAMALAQEAAAENKVFVMSLSAPFISVAFKDALDQTEPYWDYIVSNEKEAIAWARSHGVNVCSSLLDGMRFSLKQDDDIPTLAQHMANLPKFNKHRRRVAIITQGRSGTVFAVSGVDGYKSIPVKEISTDDIVDTTGAGDAFAGALLAGIVQNQDLEICVDMGHWLAHLVIQEIGANYPFPQQQYQ